MRYSRTVARPRSVFDELLSLNDEFNRLFDGGLYATTGEARPAMNVWSNDEALIVDVELPGVASDDIEVTVNDDVLEIRAKRTEDKSERRYHRRERPAGSLEHSVRLPHPVDAEKVTATSKNGILRVTLPVAQKEKSHRIQVQAA